MNKNKISSVVFPVSICLLIGLSQPATAELMLYKKRGTTFSTDGYFNTFYVSSDVNRDNDVYDRKQARVRMGYLPNWIGFNFKTESDGLTMGGRASFWVSINDSQTNGTATSIDVRQFYGTIGGKWGEVLMGKDFGLFSRSNIFLDEMLAGVGNVSDTLGLVDGKGVSFGNIGTGFPYPFPTSQITYRNNNLLEGLRLAVGIMDPYDTNQTDKDTTNGLDDKAYQEAPRYEFEFSYQFKVSDAQIYTWMNGTYQKSKNTNHDISEVTSKGLGYGVQTKIGPWSVTTSGFQAKGINPFFTNNSGSAVLRNIDSDGYLVQGSYTWGDNRLAMSYGKTTDDGNGLGEKADFSTRGVIYTRTINKNLRLLTEYTQYRIDANKKYNLGEDTNTFAIGAVLNW